MPAAPRVFSIPPGVPFLPTLAQSLVDGRLVPGFDALADPLALASATIYLPSRRSARALEEAFLDLLGGEAVLLPRIAPLGDVDEDLLATDIGPSASALDLPPAIDPLARRMALARLVSTYSDALARAVANAHETPEVPGEPFFLKGATPAAVLHLADELARLIDALETEEVDFEKIRGLDLGEHDKYWAITLEFLKIAAEAWPHHLAEIGRLDPSQRRSELLRAERRRLQGLAGGSPVIAAGSTGSIPATAALIETIARLPNGAVVLPGLDTVAEDGAFPDAADDEPQAFAHPQAGLARLLKRLGLRRADVVEIGRPAEPVDVRRRLLAEALRPSDSTERWVARRADMKDIEGGLAGLTLVEPANEREEALAVALVLRATLAEEGRTAALVTPDRKLARRVAIELKRWDIVVEDSAGRPLAGTPPAVLAILLAEAAGEDLGPLPLLALLRHPLARFGLNRSAFDAAVDALEVGVLRGPAPAAGIAGLRRALAASRDGEGYPSRAKERLKPADWDAAADLLDRLEHALVPLLMLAGKPSIPLADLAAAEIAALEAVSADSAGEVLAFADTAGEMLADRLAALELQDSGGIRFDLGGWAPALAVLLGDLTLPAAPNGHPRLQILGLLEARLLAFDKVVLGGLVEGTWPPLPASDPWLNRAARREVGLTPPERRIGLSAHDFVQTLGAAEAVLIRPVRSGGQPTVASRFLQRLAAFAGEEAWTPVVERGADILRLARLVDRPAQTEQIHAPEPKPPRALRPAKLSVTEIETLLRDPYAIYARRVLKLEPLDGVAEEPGPAERGSAIHDALAEFVREKHDAAAPDAFDALCRIGREKFGPLLDLPEVAALWWPRFERAARWFLGWHAERAANVEKTLVEQAGRLEWQTAAGRTFSLTGRADRVDLMADGWSIVDYKTGAPPGESEVKAGFASQMPLEGAMLLEGKLGESASDRGLAELLYVQLSGGSSPGQAKDAVPRAKRGEPQATASELAVDALDNLRRVIDRFENEDQAYLSSVAPKADGRWGGDYDHLARIKEWSKSGGEPDEEPPPS